MTTDWPTAEAAMDRAVALDEVGRTIDALEDVEASLTLFPDHAGLHVLRAQFLVDLRRGDEAVEAAKHALWLGPELGVAHTVYARALIAAGGDRARAVEAAATGVDLDFDDDAMFTLVRALLERGNRGFHRGYRRRDLDEAEAVARTIGVEWPTSPLGPLALACVSLARARRFHYETQYRWWAVPILVLVVPGALLWLLVDGIVGSIRRAPHLREADRHLHAGLALDPQNPHLQAIASDVLRHRFRFVRSISYELGAAAIDAGYMEPDELVGRVSRRVTGASVIPLFTWPLLVDVLDGFMSRSAGVAMGVGLGLATIAGIVAFRHAHARMLPARLRLELDARVGPLLAAMAATAELAFLAAGVSDDPQPRSWWLASAWLLPLVALLTAFLLLRFVSARRSVRPGDLSLLDGEELVAEIARRLTRVTGVAIASWFGTLAVVLSPDGMSVSSDAVVTALLALATMAGSTAFRQRLVQTLPAHIQHALDAKVGPLLAAGGGTALLAVGATGAFLPSGHRGYGLGCLLALPAAVVLVVRLVRARRAAIPGTPGWRTVIPFLRSASADLWASLRRRLDAAAATADSASGPRLSSPRRRLAACLLDVVVATVTLGVGWLIWALVVFRHGQSPGKQMLGMRVVSTDTGTAAGYRTMLLRDLVGKPLGLAVAYTIIGSVLLFWLLWDSRRQQLWDRVLHTVVVDVAERDELRYRPEALGARGGPRAPRAW